MCKKILYLFSQWFGNSHSCVQINSSDYCDGVSLRLKHLNSYDYIFNLFLIHFESRESMLGSHQNTQTSKEIGVDISILAGYSVLC